jgi:dTDP-D-glucose 4,6-dehydratase
VVKKILDLFGKEGSIQDYIEPANRQGQDVRYAIDDSKLKNLGWNATAVFDTELEKIVEYYRNNFIW